MNENAQLVQKIPALLQLFRGRVPDQETNDWVLGLAMDQSKWTTAHGLFDKIRNRNLTAIAARNRTRECQYCFEEVCLQTLYNETQPRDPFDDDVPGWVTSNAISLAEALGIPRDSVLQIMQSDG